MPPRLTSSREKLIFVVFFLMFGIGGAIAQNMQGGTYFYKHEHLPGYGFRKMKHPEIFQGNKKKKNYFEGWYFKMVSADGSSILSVIPGIALSRDGKEQHAFVQVIDGKTAQTYYYSFPIEEFVFSKDRFAIQIAQNYFSAEKLVLNLRSDSSSISGEVKMTGQVAFPSGKILNAGIMGWYRFVPLMECYHGVVSLTHRLEGNLVKDGKAHSFGQGFGYIEKDWGSSMPSAWVWMQSNHFTTGTSSLMLSVANVPFAGKSFTGFLGFFLHGGTLYRFATYTHAKLQLKGLGPDTIKIAIRDRKNRYDIVASRRQSGLLKAPVEGSMDRRIPESIDASIVLTVLDRKGKVIFRDSTSIAGLELVGNQELLARKLRK